MLINTSFSIPCVSRSFLAASKFSAITSLMVFKIETTVSSEKFWEELCCPPGRFFTKLGIACLPTAVRHKELVLGEQAESGYEVPDIILNCTDHIKKRYYPYESTSFSYRIIISKRKGPGMPWIYCPFYSFIYSFLFQSHRNKIVLSDILTKTVYLIL